jgi:hypothetical protein
MTEVLRLTKRGADGTWYVDLELSKPQMEALGRFMAQWGFLEFLILEHSRGMARCLGSSIPEAAKSDSFRKRLQAWRALATEVTSLDAEYARKVLSIVERVGSIVGERHNLMHGRFEWRGVKRNSLLVFSRTPDRWEIDRRRLDLAGHKVAVLNYDLMYLGRLEIVPDALPRKQGRRGHSHPLPAGATQNRPQSNRSKRRPRRQSSRA